MTEQELEKSLLKKHSNFEIELASKNITPERRKIIKSKMKSYEWFFAFRKRRKE